MDYNFFAAQSRAVVDPARREAFSEEMLQTYMAYFNANYAGNRAPLNIGHHFFDYQDGAYREALETFARTVCALLEVRCTTYSKLADFMDRLDAPTLEAYRNGDFPHAVAPAVNVAAGEPDGTTARSLSARYELTQPAPTLAASAPDSAPAKSLTSHRDLTRPAPTWVAGEAADARSKSLRGHRHLAGFPSGHGPLTDDAPMVIRNFAGTNDNPISAYHE